MEFLKLPSGKSESDLHTHPQNPTMMTRCHPQHRDPGLTPAAGDDPGRQPLGPAPCGAPPQGAAGCRAQPGAAREGRGVLPGSQWTRVGRGGTAHWRAAGRGGARGGQRRDGGGAVGSVACGLRGRRPHGGGHRAGPHPSRWGAWWFPTRVWCGRGGFTWPELTCLQGWNPAVPGGGARAAGDVRPGDTEWSEAARA